MHEIATPIPEGASATFTISWFDKAGAANTPASMVWSLTSLDGTVVNERSDVAITSLSTSNTITLSGADTYLWSKYSTKRVISLSGTLSDGDKLTESIVFTIENVPAITDGETEYGNRFAGDPTSW